MNLQIQALAERSGYGRDRWNTTEEFEQFLNKFAELIVRECALVVHKKTGPKSALNVLEHFGVEE